MKSLQFQFGIYNIALKLAQQKLYQLILHPIQLIWIVIIRSELRDPFENRTQFYFLQNVIKMLN